MRLTFAWLAILSLAHASLADEAPVDAGSVREAVTRGLRVVEKAAANYPAHRTCFSCHHQTLPMLALVSARAHGLEVDAGLLETQADFSRDDFRRRTESMAQGRGVGGGAMTVGYGLWALELAGRKPDEVTESMVEYLLKVQRSAGPWMTAGRRPPLEESHATCTVLAIEGMRRFASPSQRDRVDAAVEKARAWLADAPIVGQEDRTSRLWGLHRLGADPERIREARDAVLSKQREDGGWPSRDDLESDAYATGQTLVRLHSVGMDPADPAYRRGVGYLLRTQQGDGSWKVETRSRPFQTFFDNGDPHGKDQFISIAATSWAVAALADALDATGPP